MGIIDLLFFAANSLKIPEGGWLPLVIAAGVFVVHGHLAARPARASWKKCAPNPCR